METVQIEIKNVKVGDKILGEDGAPVTITKICKGMPLNTVELKWSGGWFATNPNTLVERVNYLALKGGA
jgi:hypothetical protein